MNSTRSFYAKFVSVRPVPGAIFIRLHTALQSAGRSAFTEMSTEEAMELRDNLNDCIRTALLYGSEGIVYDNTAVSVS